MKIVTASSGKKTLKLSMKDWIAIGKNTGWIKEAGAEQLDPATRQAWVGFIDAALRLNTAASGRKSEANFNQIKIDITTLAAGIEKFRDLFTGDYQIPNALEIQKIFVDWQNSQTEELNAAQKQLISNSVWSIRQAGAYGKPINTNIPSSTMSNAVSPSEVAPSASMNAKNKKGLPKKAEASKEVKAPQEGKKLKDKMCVKCAKKPARENFATCEECKKYDVGGASGATECEAG